MWPFWLSVHLSITQNNYFDFDCLLQTQLHHMLQVLKEPPEFTENLLKLFSTTFTAHLSSAENLLKKAETEWLT